MTGVCIALCRPVHHMDGYKKGIWTGKKIKEPKKSSKTIDIVSHVLKASENGVTCVFVVHFRSSDTFKSL